MKNLADRINNYEDIMDSRDIVERIEELESEISDLESERDELIEERTELMEDQERLEEVSEDDADTVDGRVGEIAQRLSEISDELAEWNETLKPIKELAEQCEGYGDWKYGEALIRDSYFETYAQQLAEDIGAIPENAQWPACHIDWEAAARALQLDYMQVDFDGVDYWMRS